MSDNIDPHFDEEKLLKLPRGRVLEKQRGEYRVLFETREILCGIRSRLRKELVYPESRQRRQSVDQIRGISQVDPVAVGDFVRFETTDENPELGVIHSVDSRKNQLSRRDPGPRPRENVICSNVDYLVLVVSIQKPIIKTQTIDRFMLAGAWEDIPTILVFNKMDLAGKGDIEKQREIFKHSQCRIAPTSALTGDGVDELYDLMRGRTSVFVGPSGTGKSTLLNRIQPGLKLRTQQISFKSSRGKHTTTHLEAFPLDDGGLIVDTPGIKSLALWNLDPEELITLYPEIAPQEGKCKFGASCKHQTEPGCAVKDAVTRGEIHPERYESYISIHADLEMLYGKDYID